ncbi:DUF4145 domain-containing protein [Actinomycetospora sp. OC33-EN08]|uniref:DUF4145 domain-containing protein n=1 Tax=Actinomycetospora aurantiaca TaxID=3129233 RepID=A0ABU8MM90_9PSEU
MPSAVCGWCGVHSNMSVKMVEAGPFDEDEVGQLFGLYKCDHCTASSLGYARVSMRDVRDLLGYGASVTFEIALEIEDNTAGLMWLPHSGANLELNHTPEEIADAAKEARACLNAGYRRASVQLARSVVEATAKDKGITVHNIAPKINEMFNQRLIREHIRDGAHEVRHLGNDMAHGDFTEPVTDEDAQMVLTLMHEVLVEVYESPGRVREAQSRRAARSAGQQP